MRGLFSLTEQVLAHCQKTPQQSLQFPFFILSFDQTYIKTAEEAFNFPRDDARRKN